MKRPSRRWGIRHLLLAWAGYWVGLVLVTLLPAIKAILAVSGPDGRGSVSAGFADDVLNLTVKQAGVTTWTGSISFLSLVLLTAGPPLLIWVAWLVGASRTNNADDAAVRTTTPRNELYAADPRTGIVDASKPKRSALEES